MVLGRGEEEGRSERLAEVGVEVGEEGEEGGVGSGGSREGFI